MMNPLKWFRKKPKKIKSFSILPSLVPNGILSHELSSLAINPNLNLASLPLAKQARSLEVSNALLDGYFKMMEAEILGENGFVLDMVSEDKNLNEQIERDWWDYRAKIYKGCDFWDIEKLALLHYLRDGEVFIHLAQSQEGLKISILDPLKIPHHLTNEGKNIYYGIEFDPQDNPLFYFYEDRQGKLQKLEAQSIIHIFKKHQPSQVRGISNLSSIIVPAHLNDTFKSSELKRARLQGEITGFFTKEKGDFEVPEFEEEKKEVQVSSVEVGKMQYIDEDVKPHFIDSHNPTNIEFFIKDNKKEIAKALGVSYATLTGDMQEANYSSMRYGSSEQKRIFKSLQNTLIRKLCMPIFEQWIKTQIILGIYPPSYYEKILYSYSFKPQGWEYIDPLKEMNANKVAILTGQKTISETLRERGKELDAHIAELEKEKEIYQKLGENQEAQSQRKI